MYTVTLVNVPVILVAGAVVLVGVSALWILIEKQIRRKQRKVMHDHLRAMTIEESLRKGENQETDHPLCKILGDYSDERATALIDQIVAARKDKRIGSCITFGDLMLEAFQHLTNEQYQMLDEALKKARQRKEVKQ